MLRGDGERVEEHQEDHEPIEDIGLDCSATLSSAEPIPPAPVAAAKGQEKERGWGGGGREIQISCNPKGSTAASFQLLTDLASLEQCNLVVRRYAFY